MGWFKRLFRRKPKVFKAADGTYRVPQDVRALLGERKGGGLKSDAALIKELNDQVATLTRENVRLLEENYGLRNKARTSRTL